MKYATTILLALSFIVAEIHTFWHNDSTVENWILGVDRPMPRNWNIKYAGDQAVWILVGIAMFCYGYSRNLANRTSVTVFLIWCVADTCLYFYNFKTFGYGIIYWALLAMWLLLFWVGKHKRAV